jgi:hypothetical protein
MAVLTIDWKTMDRLPALEAPVLTGVEEGEEATAAAPEKVEPAEKPFLIWVADENAAEGFDQLGKVILADDRVAIGSHAFTCVKMTPAQVAEDPALKEKGGKEVPRLVFVSADYSSVTPVEKGRLSVGGTYDVMKATARKHYKNDFDKAVREVRSILTEYDKVGAERSVLEDKEKRASDKELSASEKKDIESKRAELDKRQAAAEEKHKKIWDLKPKAA